MSASKSPPRNGRSFGFIDKDGNVYREFGDAERLAINAAGERVCRRYTCMITAGRASPRLLGSGTIIAIGDGLFVATARHLFDDHGFDDEVMVWWGERDERLSAIEIREAPELDLAAIFLGPQSQIIQRPDASALDQLDRETQDISDDLMIGSGVPEEFFEKHDEMKTIWAHQWSLGLVALPHERWPRLDPPVTHGSHLVLHYSDEFALDRRGKRMRAVDPHGLSGGGVWRIAYIDVGVWTPRSARLVGAIESTQRANWRWLCATRIRHWLQLVWKEWPSARDAIRDTWPGFDTTS